MIHFSGLLRRWFAQGGVAAVTLENNTQVMDDIDNKTDTV